MSLPDNMPQKNMLEIKPPEEETGYAAINFGFEILVPFTWEEIL